jgi:sulfur-oxidizing protein SoxX
MLSGLAIGIVQQVLAADVSLAAYEIVGDSIPAPLEGRTGDPQRGRKLVLDRETGNCLICHQVPVTGEPSQGDLAPTLAGVGGRLTVGQLRYRLVDQSRLNPVTLMPAYYRVDGLTRVALRFRDKPVFAAQEIEDVVSWLATLRD